MIVQTKNDVTVLFPEQCCGLEEIELLNVYFQQLLENGYRQIVVNLSKIRDLSLQGLGRMTEILNKFSYCSVEMTVICDNPRLNHLMDQLGVSGVLNIQTEYSETELVS